MKQIVSVFLLILMAAAGMTSAATDDAEPERAPGQQIRLAP